MMAKIGTSPLALFVTIAVTMCVLLGFSNATTIKFDAPTHIKFNYVELDNRGRVVRRDTEMAYREIATWADAAYIDGRHIKLMTYEVSRDKNNWVI